MNQENILKPAILLVCSLLFFFVLNRLCKKQQKQPEPEEQPADTNIIQEPKIQDNSAKTVSFKNLKKKSQSKKKASKVCKKEPISEYFSFSVRGFSDQIRDLKYLEDDDQKWIVGVQQQSIRVARINSLKSKTYETNSFDFKDMFAEHVAIHKQESKLDILIGTDESQKLRRVIYNTKTGRFNLLDDIVAAQLHKHEYLSLDFMTSHVFLTCGSEQDTTMKLWNLESGKVINTVDTKKWKHSSQTRVEDIWTLATRMSEVVVYSLSKTSTIEKKAVLAGHKGEVKSVAFSSDTHYLATNSIDSTLKLWNLQTQSMLYSLPLESKVDCVGLEHLKDKRSAAIEKPQDLKLMVALAQDQSVRVLKVAPFSGKVQEIAQIQDAVETNIRFLQFTVDWDTRTFCIMASGYDGRINIFEVNPQ